MNKYTSIIICIATACLLWFFPVSADIPRQGQQIFAVFIAVILSFLLRLSQWGDRVQEENSRLFMYHVVVHRYHFDTIFNKGLYDARDFVSSIAKSWRWQPFQGSPAMRPTC
jgi:hypothetical protein